MRRTTTHQSDRRPAFGLLIGLLLAGCAGPPAVETSCDSGASAPAIVARSAPPLVLAAAGDPIRSERFVVASQDPALDGRLDGLMGARSPVRLDFDESWTWTVDRQFSWNGRLYDTYGTTVRTLRRSTR